MKFSHLIRFAAGLAMLAGLISAQDRDRGRDRGEHWDRARDVVGRTISDLQHIERREAFRGDERDRYDHALRALADVDRGLADGHFDRGKIDEAIEHVDHVTRNRMLDPRERDQVMDDLRDLRRVREEWR